MQLTRIHHLTAISANASGNHDFYAHGIAPIIHEGLTGVGQAADMMQDFGVDTNPIGSRSACP